MATLQILAERRALASLVIERRAQGLARAFGISIPPLRDMAYPDAEHKQADADERIAAILTAVLRAKDPKAAELKDQPRGEIHEQVTTYQKNEKGAYDAESHSQPLRR
jgi:hypothetical protein